MPAFPALHTSFSRIRLIRIIPILDIPPAALELHVSNLINFLQCRLFALRANLQTVIRVMLEYFVLFSAVVAMVDVEGHVTPPSCKR